MTLKTYLDGWTTEAIEAFAERIDVRINTVYCYLNGKRRPSADTAQRIEDETRKTVTFKEAIMGEP